MQDSALIALAASEPHKAVEKIQELIRLRLRIPTSEVVEYPVTVTKAESTNSFSVSLKTPNFTLDSELDLEALSEIVFDFNKIFNRFENAFNKRSEATLRGLFSLNQTVPCRDVYDVEPPNATLKTETEDSIASHIIESRSLLVLGASSSGKTTAVVAACKTLAAQRRTRTLYCDLSLGLPAVAQLLEFSLSSSDEPHRERIIVLDNIHAQLEALPLICEIRDACQILGVTSFIFISWPSARSIISDSLGEVDRYSVSGDRTIYEINFHAKVPLANSLLVEIQRIAKGDVLIGTILLENFRRHNRLLNETDIHKLLLDELRVPDLSSELEDCLFDVCRINLLDIPVKFSYLVQKHANAVDDLIRDGLLRVEGEYVRIGHRSRARLFHAALVNRRFEKTQGSASDEMFVDSVLEYFRTLRRDELFSILSAVDAAIAESEPENQTRTKFAAILRSASTLVRQLEYAQSVDISWNNNFASAVFSALAFSWASPREWRHLADWIRKSVVIDDSGLSYPQGIGLERLDFDQIAKKMADEDNVPGRIRPQNWESVENLNLDIAHRNWLIGLLLCFEGSAVRPDRLRRKKLLSLAEKYTLPSGGYYPQRVPWITARVLMGLGACGETVETNEHVRRSSQWLLSLDRTESLSAPAGLWPSGTGIWNTSEQCTAMVILALRSIGVPHQQIIDESVVKHLVKKLGEFSIEKDQIDILTTLECLSEYRAFDSDSDEILNSVVQQYCAGISTNVSSIDPIANQEESSKAPFVVNSLLNILWEQLARTLDSTLFSLGSVFTGEKKVANPTQQPQPTIFEKCEQLLSRLDLAKSEKRKAIVRARSAALDQDTIDKLNEPIDQIERAVNSILDIYKRCKEEFTTNATTSRISELEIKVANVIFEFKGMIHDA